MTYAVATTSERVRTYKSDHCACARMRDMRLDESWTGRIWDTAMAEKPASPKDINTFIAALKHILK